MPNNVVDQGGETDSTRSSPAGRFLPASGKFLASLAERVIPGLVLFGLGYVLVQSIELDLKEDQFQAETADRVRQFVQYLYDGPAPGEPDRRRSTAIALGVFGRVSVVPLLLVMEEAGTEQIIAAREGLLTAGRIDPAYTCAALAPVVADATGAYNWETQKNLAQVVGLIDCRETEAAVAAVDSLCDRIRRARAAEDPADGRAAFNATVGSAVPDQAALKEFGDSTATALLRMGAAVPGRCGTEEA